MPIALASYQGAAKRCSTRSARAVIAASPKSFPQFSGSTGPGPLTAAEAVFSCFACFLTILKNQSVVKRNLCPLEKID